MWTTAARQTRDRAHSRARATWVSGTMRRLVRLLLLVAIAAAPLSAHSGEHVAGLARVVDGDTLHFDVAGRVVKVRLRGVAAPERDAPGGAEATRFVARLVRGREVRCELDGTRSKDRVVGTCFVAGVEAQDIGAAVIAAGLARDCPRFSGGRYRALERPEAAVLAYPSYCVPRARSARQGSRPAGGAKSPAL